MFNEQLPIAVIGAGPVGLAAAAELVERGLTPVVFEAGTNIGASVRAWGHVRLFSPWRYVVDDAARALLEPTGWRSPDPDSYPTGQNLVDHYLVPLAAHPALAPHIRTGTRVTAITRQGCDKMKDTGRAESLFVLHVQHANGHEEHLLARAVIDASGTYTRPNPVGGNGLPAIGERALADRIWYGIPDVLGNARERYAGKRVLVAGSGHSAFNALLDLAALAEQEPATTITWVVRRSDTRQLYGGQASDGLPARGALGARMQQLVAAGLLHIVTGCVIDCLDATPKGIVVSSATERLAPVDEIIAATGFRPDLGLLSELRLGLDSSVEAPSVLAPLIDPNVHSCGSVPPHGVDQLSHPEPGLYIVGMKSYGRAPTFLLLTGYEQVRSVAAALAGDWVAARDVRLVLPETGVCSSNRDGDCCAPIGASRGAAIELVPLHAALLSRSGVTTDVLSCSAVDSAATCCVPATQATCCVPAVKADCCGTDGSSCGCEP